MERQPTEAQEAANAAYVWRKSVQTDLLGVMRDPAVSLETAQWWFERFVTAYKREIQCHAIAKAKPEQIGEVGIDVAR